jgi:glycosyltransferase involved in cell wall biosynthesis
VRIDFVSNLPLSQRSGGWSGISAALYDQLRGRAECRFVGPIAPPKDLRAKALSKARRLCGAAGSYHFFSERRLQWIANQVAESIDLGADIWFFHGQTPWIRSDLGRPFATYVDAPFPSYLRVFLPGQRFRQPDIDRISDVEATWLRRAEAVCFGSAWALNETVEAYGLARSNMHLIGVGGSITPPMRDTHDGSKRFVFISLDFAGKGGWVCWRAFQRVHRMHRDARLTIIGQRPPDRVLRSDGVEYIGRLDKSNPADLQRFREALASAFAIVHPTRMDTMGMVLIESAYFGCPAIAPRSFGIPELVRDGHTGFLVDPGADEGSYAERMMQMCDDATTYASLRRNARAFALESHTWDAVGARLALALKIDPTPVVPVS